MKTPEEILSGIKCCYFGGVCDDCSYEPKKGRRCTDELIEDVAEFPETTMNARDDCEAAPKEPQPTPKPLKYWDAITAINAKQEAKGEAKYGEPLEENTTLTARQRIEHLQEELIDALKYAEHLKQILEDGITANDYQRAALRTASGMNYEHHGMLINGVLGLSGESGEVSDLVKKHTFQGHELDTKKIAEELGDVAWYLAVTAHAIGYDLGTVFQMNVDKLKKRYPDGFDKSRSINREEEPA